MRRIMLRLSVVCLLLGAGQARAVTFSNIAVFGDSLSDVGNIFTLSTLASPITGVIYPSQPYFAGRFSNGPIWVDYLGAVLGKPEVSRPWTQGGANYAFGGANTDTRNAALEEKLGALSALGHWGVRSQIAAYADTHANAASDVLNVVWGGGNDFLDGRTDPLQSAFNTATNIALLHELTNAREFLVPNLPPIGLVPRYREANGPGGNAQVNLYTAQYNAYLSVLLDSLESTWSDTRIYRVDVYSLFLQMLQNPLQYGFTNVTDRAYNENTGTIVSNPDQYLFWDGVHPTGRAHQFLAQAALNALSVGASAPVGFVPVNVPEPVTLMSLGIGLLVVSRGRRGSRAHLLN